MQESRKLKPASLLDTLLSTSPAARCVLRSQGQGLLLLLGCKLHDALTIPVFRPMLTAGQSIGGVSLSQHLMNMGLYL